MQNPEWINAQIVTGMRLNPDTGRMEEVSRRLELTKDYKDENGERQVFKVHLTFEEADNFSINLRLLLEQARKGKV